MILSMVSFSWVTVLCKGGGGMLQAHAGALADAAQSTRHCKSPTSTGHTVSTCLCMHDDDFDDLG